MRLAHWQRGVRYFKGKSSGSDGRQIFIKTDGVNDTLGREIVAASVVAASGGGACIPQVLFSCLDGPVKFAGFEWLEGKDLDLVLEDGDHALSGDFLFRQIIELLNSLSEAKVIHRDITPANIFVCFDEAGKAIKLMLIDFAFAVYGDFHSSDKDVPEVVLRDLCSGFKPSQFSWDDAYSFKIVAQRIEQTTGSQLGELISFLDKRIGKLVYRRDPDPPRVL